MPMQSNCFKHTFSNGQKTAEGPQLAVTVRGQDQTLTVATVSQMSPADFSSLWRVRFVHWTSLYAVKVHCHQGICRHCKCHIRCAVNDGGAFAFGALHLHTEWHKAVKHIARQLSLTCLADANTVIKLRSTCTHCHLAGNRQRKRLHSTQTCFSETSLIF